MAVKKTTKTGTTKAAPKKAAPKKAAPKAAAKTTAKAAPKKKAPAKKAAVKLTDKQTDLLKKVADAKDSGYLGSKAEGKALESLQTKKLVKRGVKDKTSGSYRYVVSKAGEKHISTPSPSPSA
jgi:hypothetical protein